MLLYYRRIFKKTNNVPEARNVGQKDFRLVTENSQQLESTVLMLQTRKSIRVDPLLSLYQNIKVIIPKLANVKAELKRMK